ncbi:acyltransferase family protein [Psychrobium sp. MM17-31]|uniref:acyltransferase family protein n=1 Tax=Psychrobium sp. MM17-31 TaxID=2917758 RepID=UPI001EF4F2DC|nr:acyltransferase family protein [Psychrobium sp. MM17-31]MCG7533202.1 acyltransferase family protein [Psychrobium sp. MM17-31]
MSPLKSKFRDTIQQLFVPDVTELPPRRHDLDWLRVLAFGLLILFHSGMFYVENWGFHAKSQYRSETLESVMLLIQPWRMAILWVIAGIAIKFILAKITAARFIYQRSLRILIPLLFGILVVVPPQLYVEMTQNNDLSMDFWTFMQEFYNPNTQVFDKYSSGIWPHVDVNHLWFLRSLWKYSLVILLLAPLLNTTLVTRATNWLMNRHITVIVLTFSLPLFTFSLTLEGDDTRYAVGFTCMLYGYLIGWHANFWHRVTALRIPLLITLIACASIVITFYNMVWLNPEGKPEWISAIGLMIYNIMRITGIFCAFGFGYHYLNKPSARLNYLNEAVYPFYMLHQTLIIVIGYHLTAHSLGPIVEPTLVIFLTTIGCFALFELIKRIDVLRFLFGLKMKKRYRKSITFIGRFISAVAMLVIGLEIIF